MRETKFGGRESPKNRDTTESYLSRENLKQEAMSRSIKKVKE